MMGDFNVDLAKGKGWDGYSEIRDSIEDNWTVRGWKQLVMDYTRIAKGCSGITRTLIDHIWTNIPRIVVTNGLLEIPWSDHDMPWAEITLKRPIVKLEKKKARVFQKFSAIELEEECKKVTWDWINKENDVEPEKVSQGKICDCKDT